MQNRRRRPSILGAKIFAIAAVVLAALALAQGGRTRLFDFSVDSTVYTPYIVVHGGNAVVGFAVFCGISAALYYLGGRALHARLSRVLVLTHFLLWILALVIFVWEMHALPRALQAGQDPNESWLLRAELLAPPVAFVAGAVLFLVNFARAIFLKAKAS